MKRRQTRMPSRWMIVDERSSADLWPAVRALPRGSGVLVLFREQSPRERQLLLRRLRRLAAGKRLVIADEAAGDAARVHNLPELRKALLSGTRLVLLSPIFPTRSHPDWKPLPRMRVAAYRRLARRDLVALGGMNEGRFAKVKRLGFQAWAGIDAFRI